MWTSINKRQVSIVGYACSMLTDFGFEAHKYRPGQYTCTGIHKGIKQHGLLTRDGTTIVWSNGDKWTKTFDVNRGNPTVDPPTLTTPEPDGPYEVIDDQPSNNGYNARHHIEESTPTHRACGMASQMSPAMHGPSKRMHPHPSPAQPSWTTHDLSALREHKRVTTPQCASSGGTTERTKGTMEALSDGNLRMIYGNVSVDIMKRKGCLGSP